MIVTKILKLLSESKESTSSASGDTKKILKSLKDISNLIDDIVNNQDKYVGKNIVITNKPDNIEESIPIIKMNDKNDIQGTYWPLINILKNTLGLYNKVEIKIS
jgi:hypothetical protein